MDFGIDAAEIRGTILRNLDIASDDVDAAKRSASPSPTEVVSLNWQLRNGVRLAAAQIYRDRVVVDWVNDHPEPGEAIALPANVESVRLFKLCNA